MGSADNPVVVLTGGSSGIGAAAARRLAGGGATVVVLGRSPERTRAVADAVGTEPIVADFARLDDVRRAAAHVLDRCPRIDVLALNAGGLFLRREVTVDGHETTFQVNHLAPFLFERLLHERLVESAARAQVRVVVTASGASNWGAVRLDDLEWERRRWVAIRAYGTTKLENILFAQELARRTSGTGVSAYAFHPGVVASRFGDAGWFPVGFLYRPPFRRLMISSESGAEPLEWLATEADLPGPSGTYFDRFRPDGRTARQAGDADLARGLWERSAALVGTA